MQQIIQRCKPWRSCLKPVTPRRTSTVDCFRRRACLHVPARTPSHKMSLREAKTCLRKRLNPCRTNLATMLELPHPLPQLRTPMPKSLVTERPCDEVRAKSRSGPLFGRGELLPQALDVTEQAQSLPQQMRSTMCMPLDILQSCYPTHTHMHMCETYACTRPNSRSEKAALSPYSGAYTPRWRYTGIARSRFHDRNGKMHTNIAPRTLSGTGRRLAICLMTRLLFTSVVDGPRDSYTRGRYERSRMRSQIQIRQG